MGWCIGLTSGASAGSPARCRRSALAASSRSCRFIPRNLPPYRPNYLRGLLVAATRLGCHGMADLLELSSRIIDGDLDEPGSRITLELSEVAPGIAMVESFSNVVAVDSGEGLVLFDAS